MRPGANIREERGDPEGAIDWDSKWGPGRVIFGDLESFIGECEQAACFLEQEFRLGKGLVSDVLPTYTTLSIN